jgi:hypothetical protein
MEVDENMKCSFHILEPSVLANKVKEMVNYILEDETVPDPTIPIEGQILPITITSDTVVTDEIRASIAKDVFVPQLIVNDEDSICEPDSASIE